MTDTGNSDSGTKSNFFGHSGISPCNHRDIVGQRKWDNPWNVSNVYLSHELLEEVENQTRRYNFGIKQVEIQAIESRKKKWISPINLQKQSTECVNIRVRHQINPCLLIGKRFLF